MLAVRNGLPEITDSGALFDLLAEQGDEEGPPVEHIFSENLYTRVMTIPKGYVLFGKVHRFKTLNIVLTGKIMVYTRENEQPKVIEAPAIFESEAMTRKFGIALEKTKFANVHVTDLKDVDQIEEKFIVPESELLSHSLTLEEK
jgi:hypothetical protein